MTEHDLSSPAESALLDALRPDTRVGLFPLAIRVEEDEYIVGRIETGEFVALPEVGARAIELFQRGHTLEQAQTALIGEYGAEVELDEFVETLVELGFVATLDGHPLGTDEAPPPNLAWLQPQHVRWLFSWPVRVVYAVLLAVTGVTIVRQPSLIPSYQDFFWSTTTSIVVVGNMALSIFLLALHELAHLISARSWGMPARINLGTRLLNLVVETDVSALWAVPRQLRYRVYLAGMACDLAVMALAVVLLAYAPLPELAQALLRVVILLGFLGVLGQFHFYMRTDIYFVMLDLLRCPNLFEDAISYLRYQGRRFRQRFSSQATRVLPTDPLAQIPVRERPKVRLYAWLVLVGSSLAIAVALLYRLPIALSLLSQAAISTWRGIASAQFGLFLDGIVTLVISAVFDVLFVVTFVRNRRQWFMSWRSRLFRQKQLTSSQSR